MTMKSLLNIVAGGFIIFRIFDILLDAKVSQLEAERQRALARAPRRVPSRIQFQRELRRMYP